MMFGNRPVICFHGALVGDITPDTTHEPRRGARSKYQIAYFMAIRRRGSGRVASPLYHAAV